MVGEDFWKGALVSPYCNIKFRKSFLLLNIIPWNSETSRSSQLAFGYNSETELSLKELKLEDESTQKKKKRSWKVKLWKLYRTIVLLEDGNLFTFVLEELLSGNS